MFDLLSITKSIFKFIWKYILPSCFIVTIIPIIILFLIQGRSEITIDDQPYYPKLPIGIKLIALHERKLYFDAWLDKIIAPNIKAPEKKVDKVFEWVAGFKELNGFRNIEQHEYYTLINQYGHTNHLVRVFCLLVTVAGYQAIPFVGENDGRVIVRIPGTDEKWLKYDLGKKTSGKEVMGIKLSDELKQNIRSIDTTFKKLWNRKYTRGDKNLLLTRIFFEICKWLPTKEDIAVDNEKFL
jgi:hypothetical protein